MPERLPPEPGSSAAYVGLIQQLLPPGKAWLLTHQPLALSFVTGLSRELVRIHDFIADLVPDSDPATASGELLEAWERSVGLPEPGEEIAATDAERRLDVVARIASQNVRTEAEWVALAEAAGYTGASVTTRSVTRATCNSNCNAAIQGPYLSGYGFTLHMPGGTPNAQFEALCRRLVHAGVRIDFDYT